MKKMICLLLAMLLCLSLVACGGETSGKKETQIAKPNESEPVVTPEPETEPEPEPEPEPADPKEFFDNAAFIGDSVTLKLRNYNTATGALFNTTFLCQGSYSAAHAVNNTMYLSYQGQDITPQDALAACGADRVFILLGMNDIALYGIDKTMEHWEILIANIRETCPDIEIYIQSGTPIYLDGEVGSLNNENMDKYNVRLQAFAQEHGCVYVDVNTPFKNSAGGLAGVYCSDEFVHFTDAACELWIEILMEQVK